MGVKVSFNFSYADLSSSGSGIEVKKAEIVNILEDHVHDLKVHAREAKDSKKRKDFSVKLDFRGYEIKTVKLTVVGVEKRKKRDSGSSWVKV